MIRIVRILVCLVSALALWTLRGEALTCCRAGAVEIIMAADAPKTVAFAADELSRMLSERLGSPVPCVFEPTSNKVSIYLGKGPWIQSVGIDLKVLGRDEFRIVAKRGFIVIAGRDDPKSDPSTVFPCAGLWMQNFERGTLFGVYEFLERFAGVRMYFPGELGTVIPHGAFKIPDCDLTVRPAFSERSFSFCGSIWPGGDRRDTGYSEDRMLLGYRLRLQTDYKPCVHGINALGLAKRFKKDHPEWFVLDAKGNRGDEPCWSSGIVEEIYRDARGYLRGDSCMSRGFNGPRAFSRGWPYNCRSDRWVDLMPQDGMQRCHCPACRAVKERSGGNWATMPVWSAIAEIARRLKDEGIGGKLTCMAYWPYHDIPDFPMPENVDVMVATVGPWCLGRAGALEKDLSQAKEWADYLKRPVWLWTYANKWGPRTLPDVPQFSMRAWGEYYKRAAPWITGAFAESESDRFIYNYLNYYVFSKVCWDPCLDVESLLSEHHRLMFGPAAAEMAAFFDLLEKTFMEKVVGHYEDSDLGPMMSVPDEHRLWTEIYTPAFRRQLDGLLRIAAGKVPGRSLEARRIALFRRECFEPLDRRAGSYVDATKLPAGWSPQRTFELRSSGKGDAKLLPLDGGPTAPLLLEPDTRYRLSFFLKTENVRKVKKGGGACANVWTGRNIWLPKNNWFTGTSGWTRHEYVFRTARDARAKGSYLRFALQEAEGAATFADFSLTREEDACDLLMPSVREIVRRGDGVPAEALRKVTVKNQKLWNVPECVRDQGYVLDIAASGVEIAASGVRGEICARATLDQLRRLAAAGREVPDARLCDWPSLKWRGFMLDCGRNYQTLDDIRRAIKLMARYKYNLFHWHLADNHGWRLASAKYPQLQSKQSFSRQTGCFYSQAEFLEIVRYAAKHGITVMPELDVPGHSLAFRRAFGLARMDSPGVDETVCDLIDELCSLVPSAEMPFVHIGTDEVRDPAEFVPEAWYGKWARQVQANGRTVVGWMPGHRLDVAGDVVDMYWSPVPEGTDPARNYLDAYPYSDVLDPLEALMASACRRPGGCRPEKCIGAETCSWHDDMIAASSDVFRDNANPVFLVAMSDAYWSGRESFGAHENPFRLPAADDPRFASLVRLERRMLAQRDIVLKDEPAFPYVRQSQLRWRVTDGAGRVLWRQMAQGTFQFHKSWFAPDLSTLTGRTDTVVLETWIRSPKERSVGLLASLNGFSRSGNRVWGLPPKGEWNTHCGTIEVNGLRVPPPDWKRPGAAGNDIVNRPFADELWWIRPAVGIKLQKGWNHLKVFLPHPTGNLRDRWIATCVPVLGTSARPQEIPDLEFRDEEPDESL